MRCIEGKHLLNFQTVLAVSWRLALLLATWLHAISVIAQVNRSETDAVEARLLSTDKTLVAWVALSDLDQRGGSALTLQSGQEFDAIVFAEIEPRIWMAGSDEFNRTEEVQEAHDRETAAIDTLIQIAIVYEGNEIRIYLNGNVYSTHTAENIDLLGTDEKHVVFGMRHLGGPGDYLHGAIEDARIYRRALSSKEIRALSPDQPSDPLPYAWWDFEKSNMQPRRGPFVHINHSPNATVSEGRLVLEDAAVVVASTTKRQADRVVGKETPMWPTNPPADWVTYHLAHPGPGVAEPGDPNPIFDYKGKYHLHYIYAQPLGPAFAHVSSQDMVHWKWHKSELTPMEVGHGMYSGTGSYTTDGKPFIIYHGEGSDRNHIQFALDDELISWSKPTPIIPLKANGEEPEIRHWDPDCWRMNGLYYALSGGEHPHLMKSTDLENWKYLGPFFHNDYPIDLGVPRGEDVSCANVFKIGDKWMLLCISHDLGCRYYLGDFKNDRYLPEFHALMSWGGNSFFAPESVLTEDGRRVMWAWLTAEGIKPTGIQSLPRQLELPRDGQLRIKPLRELESLRYDKFERYQLAISSGEKVSLDAISGDAVELEIDVASPVPDKLILRLLADQSDREGLEIIAGRTQQTIKIGGIEPPFQLAEKEDLKLRIFIDKNLIEIFANDRQAAAVVHSNSQRDSKVTIRAEGGDANVRSVRAWKMRSIYDRQFE